jgi:hypothetical protein
MKDNEFMTDADRFFVWNEQCARWLCDIHPVPRERVSVVGPVQFDYLRELAKEPAPPRPEQRYVLYACATAREYHIEQELNLVLRIADLLEDIDPGVRLLVRPYPYRETAHVYEMVENRGNIEVLEFGEVNPEMIVMSKQDMIDRQRQIQQAACMINHSSTIGLEASFTDTPIIQVAFNVPHRFPAYMGVEEIQKNDHLRLFIEADFPNVVHGEEALKKALTDVLRGQCESYLPYSAMLQRFADPLDAPSYKQVFLEHLLEV